VWFSSQLCYLLVDGKRQYALALWKKLTRFLEYPDLELSSNLAENSMRPVALGRKNWLHIGSSQAGPKVAAILSVVESCRRLQVPVRDYFSAILPGLIGSAASQALLPLHGSHSIKDSGDQSARVKVICDHATMFSCLPTSSATWERNKNCGWPCLQARTPDHSLRLCPNNGQTSVNGITSRLPNYPNTNSPTHFQLRRAEGSVSGVAGHVEDLSHTWRHHRIVRLLGSCRIDHRTNSRDSIGRKTALLGVLTYRVFIGGNVYAVDSVVRDIALNPLNLSTHLS
jgi:hypothetical protein